MQIIALDPATPQLRAPPSGTAYAAPRPINISPESLTGSLATSSLSIAQTWNTTGTPTAIWLDVTDTASNAASLLMDLRSGGSTRFAVNKLAGLLITRGGFNGASTILLSTANTSISFGQASGAISWGGFTSAGLFIGTANDTILARDAANTLAQRNGVNAQAVNIYNTYTDASNYERMSTYWTTNNIWIEAQAAGTGTTRSINVNGAGINLRTGGTTRLSIDGTGLATFSGNITGGGGLTIAAAGYITWPSRASLDATATNILRVAGNGTGGALQLGEMTAPAAPAADSVRIYAEDNGSGKTRLMALFATGAAQQIAIEP